MIPLLPNIGYAEIDSAGTINDAMGSTKSQLPIQFFRLTENISGNLTIANDSSHKKIIIDTNGKTIINSSGSPLTSNSSVNVELKGSGNIQSTLKTFTSAVSSTSNTGTTTISEADSSTMVISSSSFVTQNSSVTATSSGGLSGAADVSATVGAGFGSGYRLYNIVVDGVTYASPSSALRTAMINSTRSGNAWNGATWTTTSLSNPPGLPVAFSSAGRAITEASGWSDTTLLVKNSVNISAGYNGSTGWIAGLFASSPGDGLDPGGISPGPISATVANFQLGVPASGRQLIFTNNLAIPVVLTGADPFDSVTIAAGASSTVTRDSTDGSFSLTGTISGSDGSSLPFALSAVNNGTGSLITSAYTGTFSASAF